MKNQLFQYLYVTGKPDMGIMMKAQDRWDSVGKPLRSLGALERAIIKMAGAAGSADVKMDKKAVVVLCADHGVVAEGVTQTDSSVTRIVAEHMTEGMASVNVMAKRIGADVFPVDMGMLGETYPNQTLKPGQITDRKIRRGTGNMAIEPAMSMDECLQAVLAGMDIVRDLKDMGYDIIGIGEMGIGNTTPSSALVSVLLNLPVDEVTGRGAGLSDEGLKTKIDVIERAIARYWEAAEATPIPDGPFFAAEAGLKLLAHVGGLEIAGMVGIMLGGAFYGVPVILDGAITVSAALVAYLIKPECMQYVLASHVSKEPAARKVLKYLHLEPFIDAGLCLGEGTGAVAAMSVLEMALAVYREMGSFDDIGVTRYELFN